MAPRTRLLIALAILTPLGFATKVYTGPGAWWVNDYLGGVLYVIFWMLVVLLIRPALPPAKVAIGVFLATSALETLQLWHPPLLEAIRATFLGRALIGTTFVPWDFLHYAIGCALGVLLVRSIGVHRP
jgi:hypothetical protein